jgi:uncharacterized protein
VSVYYFDTSALVKRYVAETGSAWVRAITTPASGNEIYVARISAVEGVSALVRQSPPLGNLSAVLADLQFDFFHQYQRLALSNSVVATAMRLAEAHRLRGYDAVQLASAVELNAARIGAGLAALTFVSADHSLNAAAHAESLPIEDPNDHP